MSTPESGLQGDGGPRSEQPQETAERRVAGWRRALRWVAWLGGLAIWKSQSVSFPGLELLAPAVAIGGLAAPVGDVVRDIGVFIEGWFTELFLGGCCDAELEKTHTYALCIILLPGLLLL